MTRQALLSGAAYHPDRLPKIQRRQELWSTLTARSWQSHFTEQPDDMVMGGPALLYRSMGAPVECRLPETVKVRQYAEHPLLALAGHRFTHGGRREGKSTLLKAVAAWRETFLPDGVVWQGAKGLTGLDGPVHVEEPMFGNVTAD